MIKIILLLFSMSAFAAPKFKYKDKVEIIKQND